VALVSGGYGGHGGQGNHGGQGGQGGDGDHSGEGGSGSNGNGFVTLLCANASLAQSFLTQIQQLINTLQSNGSFTQVLQARANEIAYIQNATDVALLSSNCTAYFIGLQNAKALDKLAGDQQEQYTWIAANLFSQIIQSLFGNNHGGNWHGK
jgi:hypothetical protein